MLARRCCFSLAVWLVLPASPGITLLAQDKDAFSIVLPASVPQDRYTPNGYIDNPYHSLIFNRSGVLRSYPPLGLGWWRTNFHPGGYALGDRDHVNYTSLLRMGVNIDGTAFFLAKDFVDVHPPLASAYHTKSMMSYDWTARDVTVSLRFFLPSEHALACAAELSNASSVKKNIGVLAAHEYIIGTTRWWGSDGIVTCADTQAGVNVSKIWAYGDVFVLGASSMPAAFFSATTEDSVATWLNDPSNAGQRTTAVQGRGPVFAAQYHAVTLAPGERRTLLFVLSRGTNEMAARRTLTSALTSAADSLRRQLADDERFWKTCPRLAGDWPDAWKRGWVYDFETIRMTVRRPLGIFRSPWDGMQIHAPRVVLGETAMDMLTLSYADPALAQEVLLGTFADALAPNVPCAREDGSVNMISADGSECGTAPMWGYPFKTIRAVYAMSGDVSWLRRMYPHLRAYVLWWLEKRTDRDGWLHCNNSWESGQDGSRRFLVADKNEGAVADFVRTVDVEASMAEALGMLEQSATILGVTADANDWKSKGVRRVANTREMFYEGRYHDVDGRSGVPIGKKEDYDVMMLAPVACGVAPPSHIAAIRPILRQFSMTPPPALQWPPLLFTYIEAAWHGDERQSASDLVSATADRVYRRTDAPGIVPGADPLGYRVPGVANEYWPASDVPPGGEHYGWGATLPMFIIRSIAGFHEGDNDSTFLLAPCLPRSFLQTRRDYTITGLHAGEITFSTTMRAEGVSGVACTLHFEARRRMSLRVVDPTTGSEIAHTSGGNAGVVTFAGHNGTLYRIVRRYE